MSRRTQLWLITLLGIGLVLVLYYAFFRSDSPGIAGVVAADAKFQPLDIQEPQLRLDLLENLQKIEYSGSRRNIFDVVSQPSPLQQKIAEEAQYAFVGPRLPPPPPPLEVSAQFFGYEFRGNKRVAFFSNGDDVLVVAEGDTFLNNLKLLYVGNESAEVEEVGSGRRATVPLVQPPPDTGGDQPPNP